MRRGYRATLFVGALCLGAVRTVHADLLAHEPFPLPTTQLVGMNTGSGFSGPWVPGGFNASISANYAVHSEGLTFGPLLTSGGRSIAAVTNAISGVTRPLAEPLGTNGTTRYISFLLRPDGTVTQGTFNGFFGVTLEAAGEPEVFAGKPGDGAINQYVIEDRGGPGQFSTLVPAVSGVTSFVVIKAEFGPTADKFTLYLNPLPGAPEPLLGTVKQGTNMGTVSGLTLYSTGAFSVDEIRVGHTFADVTPVPEPALGAAALVALGLLTRRRGCSP